MSGIRIHKSYFVSSLEPTLRRNILVKNIVGKFAPKVIDNELQVNNIIIQHINPHYSEKFELKRN